MIVLMSGRAQKKSAILNRMALPPEYLNLLAEMKAHCERCATIANRIIETGIGDPQLDVENAKGLRNNNNSLLS